MGDMGRLVVATITSTLCEQFGPGWQAADHGGPLTVTFAGAPATSTMSHQHTAPTSAYAATIEDGSEAMGRPIPLPNPFPGPVLPNMSTSSVSQVPPSHTPPSVAHRAVMGPEEPRPQDDPPGETLSGSIDRWVWAKGFGFVVPDGGGNDVFVHASRIHPDDMGSIHAGARVTYTKCLDAKKGKFRVDTINFLPPSQNRPRMRQSSRSPYRSPSRRPRASPSVRRHRRHSFVKRRRLTPVHFAFSSKAANQGT